MPIFALCFYKLLLDFPFSYLGVVCMGQEVSESGMKTALNMHNECKKSF